MNVLFLVCVFSGVAFGSVESSLLGIQTKLTAVVLPVVSVIGLMFAAMSLYTGNPNAKSHILYAVGGCIVGFGSQAIVDLISTTIR